MTTLGELLRRGPVVVAVGARDFAAALRRQQVRVVEVDWRPPFQPDAEMKALLEQLL
jgi:hypothetical protein